MGFWGKVIIVLAGTVMGIAAGVGSFTFIYAKGGSYLTNDPAACANCHIMDNHYDAWLKSSHHNVAVCNDCHTPHDFIGKYVTKARNGWNHSFAFTTGWFHEPLQITPKNKAVTEESCRYCHQEVVEQIGAHHEAQGAISCIRCHSTVGHME